jgi:hypothetical protein
MHRAPQGTSVILQVLTWLALVAAVSVIILCLARTF